MLVINFASVGSNANLETSTGHISFNIFLHIDNIPTVFKKKPNFLNSAPTSTERAAATERL
jgi:hypothetical protein